MLAEHVRSALGAPAACLDAAGAEAHAEPPEAARARAARLGCLPLAHALRDAAALLGDDAAGEPRDWPRLEQLVAVLAPMPSLSSAAAEQLCLAERGPSALRLTLWCDTEAPARRALLRLLCWSRLLCCVAAGRPAALRAPSPLERAMDAELLTPPDAAEHATLAAPPSFLPHPEAERTAWEAHVATHGLAAVRAWWDLYRQNAGSAAQAEAEPSREQVDAAAADDEAAFDAAEAAWAAAAGLPPPDAAAGRAAAAGCHRLPPLARTWSPVHASMDRRSPTSGLETWLAGTLRAHALPMRRLVLREIAAMAAALPDARLAAFDLQLALMLARATCPVAADALLQAAADDEGGPRSLAQYAGLLGDEA
jgi:hypothetical protein